MRDLAQRQGLSARLAQARPIPLDVTLDVAPGELLALLGPSGSGKTTILRAIAGLLMPADGRVVSDGDIWFDAAAAVAVPPQARRVGLVFQDYALFPHLTARDNVALGVSGRANAASRQTAEAFLARVNLTGLEDRLPAALSGGQQQRVALARALAREPRVLLLDEPFSAVDQMTRQRLKRELAVLRRSLNIPIILVTHDIDEAVALADRVAVLYRGRILQQGTPEDVRLRPAEAAVAHLMGESNVFEGELVAAATADASGRLKWRDVVLDVRATGDAKAGQRVMWMAPAESIVLHRRGRPSQGERENPVPGVVADLTRLGEQTAVTVRVDGAGDALLNFRLPTHAAKRNELAPGEPVQVSLLADGLHIMGPV
jgi:molybdate transport system ATP-binding protein